jgi:hypothetical protein
MIAGAGLQLIGRDWYDITSWTLTAGDAARNATLPVAAYSKRNQGCGEPRLPVRLSAA